ncbi:hypothetical protein pipiens_013152 [Culex pipiens pipiens]|uniref:C2H2-type domain-containing protein n=1 Tax=Culex pipiens pipiens TaxID=38569 RepID=A0ABD1CZJ7_CULPP
MANPRNQIRRRKKGYLECDLCHIQVSQEIELKNHLENDHHIMEVEDGRMPSPGLAPPLQMPHPSLAYPRNNIRRRKKEIELKNHLEKEQQIRSPGLAPQHKPHPATYIRRRIKGYLECDLCHIQVSHEIELKNHLENDHHIMEVEVDGMPSPGQGPQHMPHPSLAYPRNNIRRRKKEIELKNHLENDQQEVEVDGMPSPGLAPQHKPHPASLLPSNLPPDVNLDSFFQGFQSGYGMREKEEEQQIVKRLRNITCTSTQTEPLEWNNIRSCSRSPIEPMLRVPAEPATPIDVPAEPATPIDVPTEPAAPIDGPAEPAAPIDFSAEPATPIDVPAELALPIDVPAEPATPTDGPAEPATLARSPESQRPALLRCELCSEDKFFLRRADLKMHILWHNKEKPFQCKDCSKEFYSTSALKRHAVVHSGEKRSTCILCKRSFTQRSSLKTHIHSCHVARAEPPIKCPCCEGVHSSREAFFEHLVGHHSTVPRQLNYNKSG